MSSYCSFAVQDKNGKNIAESKAVYFCVHYDKEGNLVEMTSPYPVKFSKEPNSFVYIEHQEEKYSLAV